MYACRIVIVSLIVLLMLAGSVVLSPASFLNLFTVSSLCQSCQRVVKFIDSFKEPAVYFTDFINCFSIGNFIGLCSVLHPFLYLHWIYFALFFVRTGIWTQGLHLELLHQPFFVMVFFKIGSHELFAQAGFKPWLSWSLPPKQLGL
jgi:hypothetical protein